MKDIVVFKCGGSSVADLPDQFFQNIKKLKNAGKHPVIVHGGGPAIEKMLDQLNITYEFVEGLRKTTDEMMDVVEMILTGQVNPALIRRLNANQIQAVGLSGSDLQLLEAEAIDADRFGQVGQVEKVNVKLIEALLLQDIVPVISPVAIDQTQKRLNVNADTAAGAVASALKAEKLIFVTDVDGILKEGQLIEATTNDEIQAMIADGTIYGGMIPKVKAALKGLRGDVETVMIVNGYKPKLSRASELKGTSIYYSIEKLESMC